MLGVAVGMLLAAALISWGQLGRTSQSPSTRLQPQGRGPSRQQLQNLEIVAHVKPDAFRPAAVRGRYVYTIGSGNPYGSSPLLAIYDIADPQNIRKVSELTVSGQVFSEQLALVGNYAYVVALEEFSGGGYDIKLRIVDVSDPTRPREVGQYAPTGKKVYAVIVGNNYAYVGVSSSGSSVLHVLNISNPANPQFVREITNVDDLEGDGGTVEGNRLYLVHGTKGISIWNISQPDNPQRLGSLDTPGIARSVAVSGNYAFVSEGHWFDPGAEKGYLRVVDVSNPASPRIVASVDVGGDNPWFPLALDSTNNRLFVGLSDRSRTVVYNINNPTNPVEVWRGEGLFGGADFSARRLVTSPSDGMFIVWDISGATPNRLGEHGIALQPVVAALKDNYIVTNSRNGLVVFNVANPSQPQLVKHLPLQGFQMSSGRLVFAGDVGIYSHGVGNTNNLFFLNFANPTSLQLLQSYTYDLGIYALAIVGDYLYVGHVRGLDFYSISGRNRLDGLSGNTVYALAVKVDPNISGSVLYVARAVGWPSSALQIYFINDPPQPHGPVGELRFSDKIDDIAVVGDTVFVVTNKGDLYIVDASDPTNPQRVGSWTNPVRDQTYRARILVSGNFAYLSLYSEGLVVLDLSSLSVVASMKGVYVNEVAVSGNLIYAAGDHQGLYVLHSNLQIPQTDLSIRSVRYEPSQPEELMSGISLRVEAEVFNAGPDRVAYPTVRFRLGDKSADAVVHSVIDAGRSGTAVAYLPLTPGTNRSLQAIVDPDNRIRETNENNNALTVSFPDVAFPDLTVEQVDIIPSEGLVHGEAFTVRAKIKNLGGGVGQQFDVLFEYGEQKNRTKVSGLKARAEAQVIAQFNARLGVANVRVVADPDNQISESNESNNDKTAPMPTISAPDLEIVDLAIFPAQPEEGDTVRVTAKVRNNGAPLKGGFTVAFYVDDTLIYNEPSPQPDLGSGETMEVSQHFQYRRKQRIVKAVVDPNNHILETDENNNERTTTIPQGAAPDLVVTKVTTQPEQLQAGTWVTFGAEVKNQGGTCVDIAVRFLVDGSPIASVSIARLKAGETSSVSTWWQGWRAQPGSHTVTVIVDPEAS